MNTNIHYLYSLITKIIALVFLITFISCDNKGANKKSLNVNFIRDYITDKEGSKIFLDNITSLKSVNDDLQILDGQGRAIYITDTSLNLIKKYSLNDYEYSLVGTLNDFLFYNSDLILVDNSPFMKKINLAKKKFSPCCRIL